MRPSSSFSGSEPGRVSQTIAEGTGGERVCLLNLRCGFPWEGKELSGIEGQISAVGPGRTLSAAPKLIRSSLSLDNYGESPRDGEREGERERAPSGTEKLQQDSGGARHFLHQRQTGFGPPGGGGMIGQIQKCKAGVGGWGVGTYTKEPEERKPKGQTVFLKDHLREMQEGGDLGICVYV